MQHFFNFALFFSFKKKKKKNGNPGFLKHLQILFFLNIYYLEKINKFLDILEHIVKENRAAKF